MRNGPPCAPALAATRALPSEPLGDAAPSPYPRPHEPPEWVSALARYNHWMNDKLFERAATLSDETRKRDVGAFFRSIHGTLNHLLRADRVWLARFSGVVAEPGHLAPGIRSLDRELYADFDGLRRERALTDDELSTWVRGLTAERHGPSEHLRRVRAGIVVPVPQGSGAPAAEE